MSCEICTRSQASALLCPTCARICLYQLRIDKARVLLDREHLGQQLQTAVDSKRNSFNDSCWLEKHDVGMINSSPRLWALHRVGNEHAQSSARIELIANQLQALRSRIEDQRKEISWRKQILSRRRSDSESAVYHLSEREAGVLSGIRNTIKRTDHLWHSSHIKTAEARIFLCREVASLYGLQQKVKRRENSVKETYTIGGVNIPDLKEMNGKL